MRVVLDTNILVSFAIRPSREFEKLFDHLSLHGTMLVSEQTLGELLEVMSREKFRRYIPHNQSLEYVKWYAGISELVFVNERIAACIDPKDDKFLELAVSGRGDCVITGDAHLLGMRRFKGVSLLSPTAFLQAVST